MTWFSICNSSRMSMRTAIVTCSHVIGLPGVFDFGKSQFTFANLAIVFPFQRLAVLLMHRPILVAALRAIFLARDQPTHEFRLGEHVEQRELAGGHCFFLDARSRSRCRKCCSCRTAVSRLRRL